MLRFILVVCLMALVATSQVSASGKKDPMTAFLLSAVVPGGGQFYNEQPEKAVIPIAGAATFLGLYYLAIEDNDVIWDHDDDLASIGVLVFLKLEFYHNAVTISLGGLSPRAFPSLPKWQAHITKRREI